MLDDLTALSLTERNIANSWLSVVAWSALPSNWEQTWNAELRLLRSLGCPLMVPEQGRQSGKDWGYQLVYYS